MMTFVIPLTRSLFLLIIVAKLMSPDDVFAQPSQFQIDAEAAQAYADAYAARDVESLLSYLADDAIFTDPSHRFEGKVEIAAGLSTAYERITGTGPESREILKFRSGEDFVFAATIDFTMLMAVADQPEAEYRFKTNFVMILKVSEGMIVRHDDYIDTNAFLDQLGAQMSAE